MNVKEDPHGGGVAGRVIFIIVDRLKPNEFLAHTQPETIRVWFYDGYKPSLKNIENDVNVCEILPYDRISGGK